MIRGGDGTQYAGGRARESHKGFIPPLAVVWAAWASARWCRPMRGRGIVGGSGEAEGDGLVGEIGRVAGARVGALALLATTLALALSIGCLGVGRDDGRVVWWNGGLDLVGGDEFSWASGVFRALLHGLRLAGLALRTRRFPCFASRGGFCSEDNALMGPLWRGGGGSRGEGYRPIASSGIRDRDERVRWGPVWGCGTRI